MLDMVVTLEVSKLSGWLNADAYCRESKGGHTRCGVRYGSGSERRWATASQGACRGGFKCRWGERHVERSAPCKLGVEHVAHGCV